MRVFQVALIFVWSFSLELSSSAQSGSSGAKGDFQIFRKALTETHPALYRFTSQHRFEFVFDSIESQLTHSSSDLELFRALSQVMSMVREGHSYVEPSDPLAQRTRGEKLFPFRVVLNENRLVVRHSRSDAYEELERAEILSINGQTISEIVNLLAVSTGLKSAFNNAALESTLSEYDNFAFAYYYFVDTTSTFEITYRLAEDQTVKREMVEGTNARLDETTFSRMPGEPKPPFQLQIDAENQVAIMKITTFAYWVVSRKIKDYSTFFQNSFRKLREAGIHHLIIDVRNNRGGEEMIGAELLTYLIDKDFRIYRYGKTRTLDFSYTNRLPQSSNLKFPKKQFTKTDSGYYMTDRDFLSTYRPKTSDRFEGQVYVLSNNRCWSAANTFLALVKSHKVGTIIGQASGGAYEDVDGRARVSFELPNSGMKVGYPAWSFKIDSKGGNRWKGVEPDYVIVKSIDDLRTGNDVELAFTYELIRNDH